MCGYIYSRVLLGLLMSRTNVFVSSLFLYEYQHMHITGRGACAGCGRHWYHVHVLLHRPDSEVVVTVVLSSGKGLYEKTAGNNYAVDTIMYNCTHAHTRTHTHTHTHNNHIYIQNKPNVEVKWTVLQPRILEMLGSNLGPGTGCPN
jgi:hypothetical protein